MAWLDAWKYSNKSRAAAKANGDLETTIRTLENRVSDLSNKLSRYERSLHDLRMWMDSQRGRVVTAEALIDGFRKASPELVEQVIG